MPKVKVNIKSARRKHNALVAAQSGRIKWTSRALFEGFQQVTLRYLELSEDERESWEPSIAAFHYVTDKYGRRRGVPHAMRLIFAIQFIDKNRNRLLRDRIGRKTADKFIEYDDELFEALARLPHALGGFEYQAVKDFIRKSKSPS